MAKAVFKWLAADGEGFTNGKVYEAFELFNSFAVINDASNIVHIGHASACWQLMALEAGDYAWHRAETPQPMPEDEGEKGEDHGEEGGTGGHSPEGGNATDPEEGDQASGKAGKGSKGRTSKG